MTRFGGWGAPGVGTIDQTSPREIFWGGDRGKGMILTQSGEFSGAIRDAGSTPTTDIRAGLLVAKVTSSGELEEWDADATDGTQDLWGVNAYDFRAIDFNANDADRVAPVVVSAPLKASQLLIQGTALTSHTDEYLARRMLHGMGCILDDDPQGFKAGAGSRVQHVTDTTDAPTGDENGTTFFYNNAASVTVTLPTIAAGLEYTFVRVGDEELVIASTAGDDIISINDLSADSVTFTTANEHLGAGVRVRSVYVSTTLKWIVEVMTIPAATAVGTDLSALTYAVAT